MASISYDGQSFTINGRRRWLFGATIDFGRLPRAHWRDRIRAAREAGLNALGVRVAWSQHESTRGEFDFQRDLDLRAFIQIITEEKLLAVLRPGPFIGAGWDAGALPGWLVDAHATTARTGDPVFKDAVARWLGAVIKQVGDLQLTSTGAGGPIILIENEHAWRRGDPIGAQAYLGELARFLRESGARVPLLNTNNLFASAEAEIDAWIGADHFDGRDARHTDFVFSLSRQLRAVRPEAPPIVFDLPLAPLTAWGEKPTSPAPADASRMLASAIAAGGQIFLDPWCAGLTPGFLAGRDPDHDSRFFTSTYAPQAPISAGGLRTPIYHAVKRLATFVSSFDRVFASLDFDRAPITPRPDRVVEKGRRRVDHAGSIGSVIDLSGPHGRVVFIFPPDMGAARTIELSLPDGRSLPIDVAGRSAVWLLFDTPLGRTNGRATLNWCNLSPFASAGDVFVAYGRPGAHASISINGAPLEAVVPSGKKPLILRHESITLAICSYEQIDAAWAAEDAVYLGCAGFDASGKPIAHPRYSTCLVLRTGADPEKIALSQPQPRSRRPRFASWSATLDPAIIDSPADSARELGSDPSGMTPIGQSNENTHFQPIDAPRPNAELGAAFGPLWLRAELTIPKTHKATLGFFELRDRGVVLLDGKPIGVVGAGPGALGPLLPLTLPKGEHTLTILVDHLGRPSGGSAVGEPVGLVGDLYEVAPVRVKKPTIALAAPLSPIAAVPGRVWDLHDDERTNPHRIEWSFKHRRQSPIFLTIEGAPSLSAPHSGAGVPAGTPAIALLNDVPFAWITAAGPHSFRLPAESMRRGGNTVQFAVLDDPEGALPDFAHSVRFYEGAAAISKKTSWSWARCAAPDAALFAPAPSARHKEYAGLPIWWRTTFNATPADPPLVFDPTGLSVGHILLNSRTLARTVAPAGRHTGPTLPIPIPPDWLNEFGGNELIIFDEFGAAPMRCRITLAS